MEKVFREWKDFPFLWRYEVGRAFAREHVLNRGSEETQLRV